MQFPVSFYTEIKLFLNNYAKFSDNFFLDYLIMVCKIPEKLLIISYKTTRFHKV